MPKTISHMLFNLTTASTILKLLGTPYNQILPTSMATLIVDWLIDLGHGDNGRSAITHSIATAPLIALTSYIMIEYFIGAVGLETILPIDSNLLLTMLVYASLTHLFWDYTTYQGIHVPLIGWVSLSDAESQGALANIPPIILSLACVFFFWAGRV